MRLPEEKIKQGILHPDRDVRDLSLLYFTDSFSPDPELMPLVVQALEKYGWQDAFTYHSILGRELVQTDDTLLWILKELAEDEDQDDEAWWDYTDNLYHLLAQTDANLLAKHRSALLDLEDMDDDVFHAISQRIDLLTADPDICWKKIQQFCEDNKSQDFTEEIDWGHAGRLLEAVARGGVKFEGQILEILARDIDNYDNNPLKWSEPLIVRLAGLLRLAPAVPLLIKKLFIDDDLLFVEVKNALRKIATDEVVKMAAAKYMDSDFNGRLNICCVLENIHSNLSATKFLELLPQEKNPDLKIWLAQALLRQFSFEGIEPLRQMIREELTDDPEMLALRRDLLTACTLMEVVVPEYQQWKADSIHDIE